MAKQLAAAHHGRRWRRRVGPDGMAGFMFHARYLTDHHAYMESKRKKK